MTRTERLAAALAARGRTRVTLAELLDDWHTTAPELTGRAQRFAQLAAVVDELVASGVVVAPATASWDRSYTPALPKFLTVPASRRVARTRPWRTFAWRPELAWSASVVSLSDAQFVALQAVNRWLSVPHDGLVVPARLRSAEVFGDEKLLDVLERSQLFGPGRLTSELLAYSRVPPPLPAAQVGPGTQVLVIENVDPFWAVVSVLRGNADHAIGWVVWGHGNEFSQSAGALAEQFPDAPVIWYWGDLDPEGVRIAERAAKVDQRIQPHVALWTVLAALEPTDAGAVDWSGVTTEWLGAALVKQLELQRVQAGRVAQERASVGALVMALRTTTHQSHS